MQLSPIAPTSPAPSSAAAPVAAHEELGKLDFTWGYEQCEIWHSHDAIRAGDAVGAAEGYATLKAAVADLATQTGEEDVPAALVLRQGDRFVARTLEAKTISGEERDPGDWHTLNEEPEITDMCEVRTEGVDPRVAAIVDGRLVHTFRAR